MIGAEIPLVLLYFNLSFLADGVRLIGDFERIVAIFYEDSYVRLKRRTCLP